MLWILLSRNASINTKSFYHNSWEIKFMLSTQGASPPGFFFQPTERLWFFFFGQRSDAGFFSSYLYAFPEYILYMYIFFPKSTSPSTTPPTEPPPPLPLPATRQTVEFPTSHISFVMQHVLHTGNILCQMDVLCKKEFCHLYAGLMQSSKWPVLKIRQLWGMSFSDISGHRSIRICIVLPVFVYSCLRVN